MNRHLITGRLLMQRQMVRREVLDVYEVYQRYALHPLSFVADQGIGLQG